MSELIIDGGRTLSGAVTVGGAKNAVLPLLAATLLITGKTVLHNCPLLSDVSACIDILSELGCECVVEDHTITVDATNVNKSHIPEDLMRKMRSSIVFLGAIVARCGEAVLSTPGGCEIGARPIDLHIKSLKALGVIIEEEFGTIVCNAKYGIKGADITLMMPSVGATENIILAAVNARGTTVIHNAAREPEIENLCEFLIKCGAKIYGYGSGTVTIVGVEKLSSCEFFVIPDRIEASTFIAASAITGGKICIKKVNTDHIKTVIDCFKNMGCEFKIISDELVVSAPKRLTHFDTVNTMAYPGFPTDSGSVLISCGACAKGTSVLVENIFENRFKFTAELKRLGANIKTVGKAAIITGTQRLSGAGVEATDLRGGAALVVAGLAAEGETVVRNIHHIDRGYEKIENSLSLLGADIKRK